ncbi:helix-turn-helix domain-containing protein [Streptomyces sp. NPDC088763]|uniref:helix-turn-helix domain-containing protein n=1 Tax=Streptomyces sp. NPDC088763 TaxID=3365892 RepID=UPI0037F1078C
MSAWQPLPEGLPPEVRHFVEQLRLLKDRTGLSLVALGARTAYSKSSWQRYLNATQPPPRQAVVALCRVAGTGAEEAERFGVRWELAVKVWPKQATLPGRVEDAEPPVPERPAAADAGHPVLERSATADAELPVPERPAAEAGQDPADDYEDDPTLPWWDAPLPARPSPSRRLLTAAVVLAALLALTALIGALAFG